MEEVKTIKRIVKNCEYCNKPLRAMGNARKGGKILKNDWATRKYHSKCYKPATDKMLREFERKQQLEEEERTKKMVAEFIKTHPPTGKWLE